MNIKKLVIIGTALFGLTFLNACKHNSGESSSVTVVDDIIVNSIEIEVTESNFAENISSEDKTELLEKTTIKPEDIISDVVFFTEESSVNEEDDTTDSNIEDDNTDSNVEEDDLKNNNTLGELASVPEGF